MLRQTAPQPNEWTDSKTMLCYKNLLEAYDKYCAWIRDGAARTETVYPCHAPPSDGEICQLCIAEQHLSFQISREIDALAPNGKRDHWLKDLIGGERQAKFDEKTQSIQKAINKTARETLKVSQFTGYKDAVDLQGGTIEKAREKVAQEIKTFTNGRLLKMPLRSTEVSRESRSKDGNAPSNPTGMKTKGPISDTAPRKSGLKTKGS